MGVSFVDVVVELAPGGDEVAIQAAIDLGNVAKSTLGLMPFTAYRRRAAAGNLLLAYVDGEPGGYALFEVNRDRVRINHLCVDPKRRRGRVARRLVEWISAEYTSYPGILAKCREDYRAGSDVDPARVHPDWGTARS
jgi:GNAT superfamily N-acetyltransferase